MEKIEAMFVVVVGADFYYDNIASEQPTKEAAEEIIKVLQKEDKMWMNYKRVFTIWEIKKVQE